MNERKNLKLAIFDLGNVLFRIDWDQMFNSWSRDSGVASDILKDKFLYDNSFDDFERGDISGEVFAKKVNELLSINLTYDEFVNGWNAIYGEVVSDVVTTLNRLSGKIRLVAYTNTNSIHNEKWPIKYAENLKLFERIFVSSDIGHRKPERAGYEYVLEACGVEAEESIFFDDREDNIEGAKDVGINAILVDSDSVVSSTFNHYKKKGATCVHPCY